MSKFRLVILDNAKEQLDNPIAKKIIADMVFVKQKNFLRTDPNYVVTDKHDMIGTHYLIYDTTELLDPQLVFAIRTTFLARAKAHRIETPLMSLMPQLKKPLQEAFKSFQEKHPGIVDCNAWFVDPRYSKKNSGLSLSDLGYFMVCTHVLRSGFDNIVGCTNESYNASRWVEKVGSSPKGLIFEHPVVKSPHMMMLVENFNIGHFKKVYDHYKDLIEDIYEVFPASEGEGITPLATYFEEVCAKRRATLRVA